jgi:hypothetical protein
VRGDSPKTMCSTAGEGGEIERHSIHKGLNRRGHGTEVDGVPEEGGIECVGSIVLRMH